MPQIFQVVRCISCETFQVQILKIKSKWECKLCYLKQSLKHVYSQSASSKECRVQVQKLNSMRSNESEMYNQQVLNPGSDEESNSLYPEWNGEHGATALIADALPIVRSTEGNSYTNDDGKTTSDSEAVFCRFPTKSQV